MRNLSVFLALVFVLFLYIVPVIAAGSTAHAESQITVTTSPTQVNRENAGTTEVSTTRIPTSRPTSGEVEIPITSRVTHPRQLFPRTTEQVTTTIPLTTMTPTRTVTSTTIPATLATTIPVVTKTAIVYPSGPVYIPYYTYPYGYADRLTTITRRDR